MLFRKISELIKKHTDESALDDWFPIFPLILPFAVLFGVVLGGLGITLALNISTDSPVGFIIAGVITAIVCTTLVSFLIGKSPLILAGIAIATILGLYFLVTLSIPLLLLPIGVIGSIAVAEIIFWADPQKPTKDNNRFWFTAKVKLESYIDVAFGWLLMATGVGGIKTVMDNWNGIQSFAIYPALFFGVVGSIGVYIWLNSFKYRKIYKKEPEAKKEVES